MKLPLPSELRFARKQANLTQEQLASLSGVSQSVIAKIENGKVDPSYSTVVKLFSTLEKQSGKTLLVREVMHRGIASVKPSDAVSLASTKMKNLGVSQLPVVSGGKVVGLISEEDVLKAIEKNFASSVAVREIASPAPPFISSSAPASALPSILHISPLVCVFENSKLVGVDTRSDMLNVF